MILRKLKTEEHSLTRPLWERIFEEDTAEFLDYYYREIAEKNDIYVIEMDGAIRSMLHLNPCLLRVGKKEMESRYIVAVSTDTLYRHKGYMTELLKKSVRDMYDAQIAFTFLMPADENIYYPHDFRFIYDADMWDAVSANGRELTAEKMTHHESGQKILFRAANQADCKRIAQFADRLLREKYQVYMKRDWQYYERMLLEQQSQKGGILLAESEGEIVGTVLYDEEEAFSIREPMVLPGFERVFEEKGMILHRKEKKKPMIMARLLHVETLLSAMVCSEVMEIQFVLFDPVIRENNRLFILRGNEEHLVVRTKTVVSGKDDVIQKISVDALTSIIFGYQPIERIEEEEKESFSDEFKEEIRKLIPLSRVFLNEIV